MVRASLLRALAGASLALTALPGALHAQQAPLPPMPPAGGGVTERLSPEEVERAGRKREREQIVARLRELHARGEYTEMLRLIQESEKTLPNDFVLRQYGYLAQKGLDEAQRNGDAALRPDSPLRHSNVLPPGMGLPPADGSQAGSSSSAPPSPSAAAGSAPSADPQSAGGLPSLAPPSSGAGTPKPAEQVPAQPTPAAEAVRTPAAPAPSPERAAAPAPSEGKSNRMRYVFGGIAVLFAGIALVALLKRRKSADAPSAPARAASRPAPPAGATARATSGGPVPPPLPRNVAPPPFASQRDALTEVDNEVEVARDIAENIGTRSAAPAMPAMPAFDMFIPEGKGDSVTGFHENLPTMVDNLPTMVDEEAEEEPAPPPPPAAPPAPAAPPPAAAAPSVPPPTAPAAPPRPAAPAPPPAPPAPAVPAAPAAPAVPGIVSFEDLGISLFDEPKPAPAPPVSTPAAPPVAPPSPASASAAPSLPGLPSGDNPIRLDDLKSFATASETTTSSPAPQSTKPAEPDDPMSATVDLSELLFGKYESPSAAGETRASSKANDETLTGLTLPSGPPADETTMASPAGTGRTPSPFDETVATPAVTVPRADETYKASADTPISLDALGLGGASAPPSARPAGTGEGEETSLSTLHNQDTVQIPALSLTGGGAGAHPDESLDATVSLDLPAVDQTASSEGEQSFYGSGTDDATIDERTERMFQDQCERAEKAIAESNWKQAVQFLSVAAAIRPEDPDVKQRLKHAREQKRQQEAGV